MRKFFSSRADAVTWADDFERRVTVHGQRAADIAGKTVTEAIDRFFALKEIGGRHEEVARTILGAFAKAHGASPILLISALDLQVFWTRKTWGPTTRAKVFRYLRMFFNWCERYDLIERNPARRVEPPKAGDPPKHILTPARMGELLKINDPTLRAFLCLGGFAGLRTSEILSLTADDVEAKEIHVGKHGKTGERWVKRLPAFNRHWQGFPKFQGVSEFYECIRDATGGKWPANCLRHSFGSYHLARWEDAAKTAFQMGNGEAVVRKSYARAVRRSEALKWWAL